MTAALSGFAAGRLGCTATARHLLCRATLSSFLLEFDSKGFGFFDAAVQLFEQGRHLKWDLRAHRSFSKLSDGGFGRCAKQHCGGQLVDGCPINKAPPR